MAKMDARCEKGVEREPFWHRDFQPISCQDVHEFDAKMGHEIALQIKNAKDYEEKYQHPLWQGYDPHDGQDNHGGMDYLVVCAFLESVQRQSRTPIDVYDTAAWMSVTALSEESIQRGGAPVSIPDFTRGKWYMRQDIDYTLKFNLDQEDTFRDIH